MPPAQIETNSLFGDWYVDHFQLVWLASSVVLYYSPQSPVYILLRVHLHLLSLLVPIVSVIFTSDRLPLLYYICASFLSLLFIVAKVNQVSYLCLSYYIT